jgi:MFS family permease
VAGSQRASVRALSAAFLIHAVVSGAWGPRLPAIKADLGLDDGELGTALAGVALGLLVGTRVAGAAVDRFGSRALIRAGLPLYCASVTLPALAWDGASLFCGLLALGVLGGVADVAINSQGVDVEREFERPVLARLHGIWSVGLGFGAAAAAAGAAMGLTPLANLAVVGGALGLAAIPLSAGLLADGGPPAPRGAARVAVRRVLGPLLILGAIAFCSFAGEGAAADWAAVYLSQEQGAAAGLAAVGFVGFAVGMASARFAADRLRGRLGSLTLVRVGSAIAGAGLGLGLLLDAPAATIAGFFILGLGLGPVVPIVFSVVGRLGTEGRGRLVAWAATFGYLGAIVGPIIIGWVADATALDVGLAIPVALALAIPILAAAPPARRAFEGR